jgi:hypothetical protein
MVSSCSNLQLTFAVGENSILVKSYLMGSLRLARTAEPCLGGRCHKKVTRFLGTDHCHQLESFGGSSETFAMSVPRGYKRLVL